MHDLGGGAARQRRNAVVLGLGQQRIQASDREGSGGNSIARGGGHAALDAVQDARGAGSGRDGPALSTGGMGVMGVMLAAPERRVAARPD